MRRFTLLHRPRVRTSATAYHVVISVVSLLLMASAGVGVHAGWLDVRPPANPSDPALPSVQAPVNLTDIEQQKIGDLTTGGYTSTDTVSLPSNDLRVVNGATNIDAALEAGGGILRVDGAMPQVLIGATPPSSGLLNVDGASAFYGTNSFQSALVAASTSGYGVYSSVDIATSTSSFAIFGESTSTEGGIGVSGTAADLSPGFTNFGVFGNAAACPWNGATVCRGSSWAGYFRDATLGSETQFRTVATDTPRMGLTATLLEDGSDRVLVAGGRSGDPTTGAMAWIANGDPRLYHPTNPPVLAPAMAGSRSDHTATMLEDGRTVLVVGGYSDSGGPNSALATGARYRSNAGVGTWLAATPNLAMPRARHTATLLPDGSVLIAGGENRNRGGVNRGYQALGTTEIYNDTGTDRVPGPPLLIAARTNHTATRLQDGRVLIVGGQTGEVALTSTLIYTPGAFPAIGSFTVGPSLATARTNHTATLLPDGRVLIAGGYNAGSGNEVYRTHLASTEIYTPGAGADIGSFGPGPSMLLARSEHTATLLPDGRVLIVGGERDNGTFSLTSEIYNPGAASFTYGPTLSDQARKGHETVLLSDGSLMVFGGEVGGQQGSATSTQAILTVDPNNPGEQSTFGGAFSAALARAGHTASLLPDGRIFFSGGQSSPTSWEDDSVVYVPDPAGAGNGSIATSSDDALVVDPRRSDHTATPTASLFSWWDPAYLQRKRFEVENPDTILSLPEGYATSLRVDTESLGSQVQSDYDDLRVVVQDGSTWQEIARDVDAFEANPPHEGFGVFDASNSEFVQVADNATLQNANGTLELWLRVTGDPAGTYGLVSKDASGQAQNGHLTVTWEGDGTIRARVQDGGTGSYDVQSGVLDPDQWNHVGFSWGSQGMKLTINGVLADTNPYTGGIDGNTQPLLLGASGASAPSPSQDLFLDGMMDDVRWSSVQRDVAALWTADVYASALPVDADTEALWRFNNSFDDASGNNNGGTATAAPSFDTTYAMADVWFDVVATIAPASTDRSYYLYYDNPIATSPVFTPESVYVARDSFDYPGESPELHGWHIDLAGALEVNMADTTADGSLLLSHDGINHTTTVTVDVADAAVPISGAEVTVACATPSDGNCASDAFGSQPLTKQTDGSGHAEWTFTAPPVSNPDSADGIYTVTTTTRADGFATSIVSHDLTLIKPPLLIYTVLANDINISSGNPGTGNVTFFAQSEGASVQAVTVSYATLLGTGVCPTAPLFSYTPSSGQLMNDNNTLTIRVQSGRDVNCYTRITGTKTNYESATTDMHYRYAGGGPRDGDDNDVGFVPSIHSAWDSVRGAFRPPDAQAAWFSWPSSFVPAVLAQSGPGPEIRVSSAHEVEIDALQYSYGHLEWQLDPADFSATDGLVAEAKIRTDGGPNQGQLDWGNGLAVYWNLQNWIRIHLIPENPELPNDISVLQYSIFQDSDLSGSSMPGYDVDEWICLRFSIDPTTSADPRVRFWTAHEDAEQSCRHASWELIAEFQRAGGHVGIPDRLIVGRGAGGLEEDFDNSGPESGNLHQSSRVDEFLVRTVRTVEPVTRFADGISGSFFLLAGGHGSANGSAADLPITNDTKLTYHESGVNGNVVDGPPLATGRTAHTATALPDGRILIVGGFTSLSVGAAATQTTEFYVPDNDQGTFVPGPNLSFRRAQHTASLLPDGRVLIAGGNVNVGSGSSTSTEIIDPVAGTVSPGPLFPSFIARAGHTATTLLDGRILIAGGRQYNISTPYGGDVTNTTAIYTPATGGPGSFVLGPNLQRARFNHTAFLHPETGVVFLFGGVDGAGFPMNSTEVFRANGTMSPNPPQMPFSRTDLTSVGIPGSATSRILATAGRTNNTGATSVLHLNPLSWIVNSSLVVESLNAEKLGGATADDLVPKGELASRFVVPQQGTPNTWSPQGGNVAVGQASGTTGGIAGTGTGGQSGVAGISTATGDGGTGIRVQAGPAAGQHAVRGIAGDPGAGGDAWAGYFDGTARIVTGGGVAPLTLAGAGGTVANLNADLLDGQNADAFLTASSLEQFLRLDSAETQEGYVSLTGITRVTAADATHDGLVGFGYGSTATGARATLGGVLGWGPDTTAAGQASYGVYAAGDVSGAVAGYFAGNVATIGDVRLVQSALSVRGTNALAGSGSFTGAQVTIANPHAQPTSLITVSLRSLGDAPAQTSLRVVAQGAGSFTVQPYPSGNTATGTPIIFDYVIIERESVSIAGQPFCGDETVEASETCDLTNLNGQTCLTQGFSGGTLGCYEPGTANQCRYNTSGCTPSPPVSCPYISVWTGTSYTLANDIFPAAAGPRSSYTDTVALSDAPVSRNGAYELLLREIPSEQSRIDQLALVVADHAAGLSVAPDPAGQLFLYGAATSAREATDDTTGEDVGPALAASDGSFLARETGGMVTFRFDPIVGAADHGVRLILRTDALSPVQIADRKPPEFSLVVEVPDTNGGWRRVSADIHPHALWDAWAIDLTDALPDRSGPVTVRIRWTDFHKIDFVGIDATSQDGLQVRSLAPATARHSRSGDVADLLAAIDDRPVQTVEGDTITLRFPADDLAPDGTRTFLLQSTGFYESYEPSAVLSPVTLPGLIYGSPFAP